jgi:CheY-like chemotaxis protein
MYEKKMIVLLVEDHKFLAQVSCDILREIHEHQVVHVSTAAAALTAVAEQKFDIALVDIDLPDADGYQLASQIRAMPEANGIVLVALTGIGGFIDAAKVAAAGFDANFTKPMDFDVLPRLVRKSPLPGS